MLTSLSRLLTFAFRDFARHAWLSVTTIVTLALTLLSVEVLLAVNIAGHAVLEELESRLDLRVQLRASAAESDVDAFRLQLERRSEIASVAHRSRAQVLAEFQDAHRADASILEALAELGENPFGPELRIQLRRPEDFPVVEQLLQQPAFTERVAETTARDDRAALVERLRVLTGRVRFTGAVFSGVFLLVTILILVNAVRIATYTRREEAAIMRLVGATNVFIRTPFLITSILASVCAMLLTRAVVHPILTAIEPTVVGIVGARGTIVRTFFRAHIWAIAGIEFTALALLTTTVAALALRRYLRV